MLVKTDRKTHSEVAHNFKNRYLESQELQKPTADKTTEAMRVARAKIDEIIGIKKQASYGTNIKKLGTTVTEMVKFTGSAEGGESQKQRVARIDTVQIDPLLPPLYKHRKLPKGPGSPPPQVLRSPPRKLTQKDMEDWKVPPCISNWKNSRGYTIPIHMRISADGRTLQHNTINQHFADIIDALYIAERQSKIELEERASIQKSVANKEYLKKQQALRNAAIQAREEARKIHQEEQLDEEQEQQYNERQEFRYHRQRELQREERMKKIGNEKKKQIRKEQRDISQKVALGQAQPTNQQLKLDQRLFDNAGGLQAGNSDSQDDNLYDKPLFADRGALHSQTVRDGGKDKGMKRQPVKFEKQKDSIFGMEKLLDQPAKKVKKD